MANPCLEEMERAAGRKLTTDEEQALAAELKRRVRQRRQMERGESLDEAVQAAANDYAAEMTEAAIIEKRNAAINLKRRLEAIDRIGSSFASNPALGVESLLVGVNNAAPGARLSVWTEQRQLSAYYLSGLFTEIESAGLWKPFISGTLDRDIARAMWALNRADPLPATVSKEARKIAEIATKWQEVARQDANKAGAWVKRLEGYITRQSHDTFKIRAGGYDAWKAEILPKLDLARTLDGQTDAEAFLKAVYEGLASGIHLKSSGEPTGFKGPRNVAKKASAERVLHFKGADEWFDYNQRFGTGTLRESLVTTLEQSAQTTGLMRVLGTNPEANLGAITETVLKGITDPQKKADFNAAVGGKLRNQYLTVDGSTRIPVNNVLARASVMARAVENMAKLGGAIASQFSDLPVYASEMRYQGGGGMLANIADGLKGMMRGRGGHERREIGGMLGVFTDSMRGSVVTRFSPGEDGLPGVMTKMQQLFFKANLMTFWTDALRRAAYEAMSHRLALNAGRTFDQLDPDLQRVLGMFSIGSREWSVIRQNPLRQADGRAYLVPDGIKDRAISDKLRSYLVDRVDFAVLQPDARTNATLLRGTRAGTVEGEVFRFAVQFKSFTAAFMQKVVGREVYGRGASPDAKLLQALRNGNGEMLGIAQVIAWTTAFGYLSASVKDLMKGREPKDPTSWKTWADAMVQGGGMGVYGDLLFGETRKRYGGDVWGTLAGPALGSFSDLMDLWGRVKEGDDVAAAAFKTALSHTPFANVFYLRAALDYLVLHQIGEWMNPGSLKRMERRIEKETGQQFLVRPSENFARW